MSEIRPLPRSRADSATRQSTPKLGLLESYYSGPRTRWPSFLASIGFHGVLIVGLPWLASILQRPGELVAVELVSIEPLQIRMPAHLYVARRRDVSGGSDGEGRGAGRSGASSPSAGGAAAAKGKTAAAGRGSPKPRKGEGARPALRQFQLPDLPRKAAVPQTVLQPQFPPDIPFQSDVKLPQILLWAQAPVPAPPPLREFVRPGSQAPVTAPPITEAPPKLEMPNRELITADMRIASSPLFQMPDLPAPPANVAPIRTFVPPENKPPTPTAVLDQFPGEPTYLLAMSLEPAPLPELLIIPAGNQLGELPPPPEFETGEELETAGEGAEGSGGSGDEPGTLTGDPTGGFAAEGLAGGASAEGLGGPGRGGAGGESGAGFGGASGTGSGGGDAGPGTGSGGGSGPGAGSGGGSGPGMGSGGGAGGTGRGAGSGGSGAGAGGGAGTGGSGLGTGTGTGTGTGSGSGSGPGHGPGGSGGTRTGPVLMLAAPRAKLPSTVETRIEHPISGVFDVVVIGSSVMDGAPGSAGILSGKPIYSVYLQVGTPKEWMLQYCIPNLSQDPVVSGSVVTIGNPSPVRAPYPRVTVVPPPSLLLADRSVMIHGYLDDSGHFKDLRVLGQDGPEIAPNVIPFLEQWTFRPATRDGMPVKIELLLVISPFQG